MSKLSNSLLCLTFTIQPNTIQSEKKIVKQLFCNICHSTVSNRCEQSKILNGISCICNYRVTDNKASRAVPNNIFGSLNLRGELPLNIQSFEANKPSECWAVEVVGPHFCTQSRNAWMAPGFWDYLNAIEELHFLLSLSVFCLCFGSPSFEFWFWSSKTMTTVEVFGSALQPTLYFHSEKEQNCFRDWTYLFLLIAMYFLHILTYSSNYSDSGFATQSYIQNPLAHRTCNNGHLCFTVYHSNSI